MEGEEGRRERKKEGDYKLAAKFITMHCHLVVPFSFPV